MTSQEKLINNQILIKLRLEEHKVYLGELLIFRFIYSSKKEEAYIVCKYLIV